MVAPPPSILTIDFQIRTRPGAQNPGTVVLDVETEKATLEKHPEYLTGYLRNFVKEDGSTDLLVIKDPYSVDLDMNYLASLDAHKLSIFVRICDPTTSAVACASESEISQFFNEHGVSLGSLKNFVDYQSVEPGKGPIRQSFDISEQREGLSIGRVMRVGISFVEHRISL